MDLNLRGKVVVLTGASVGIGLAVAEAFAAEGANLLLAARQEDRLTEAATRIAREFGVSAVPRRLASTRSLLLRARISVVPISSSTTPARAATRPPWRRPMRSGSPIGTFM